MKKILLFLAICLVLVACGNKSNESMLRDLKYFIENGGNGAAELNAASSEFHEVMAKGEKDNDLKEKHLKVAAIIKNNNLDGAKKMYKELGGDLNKLAEKDAEAAIFALSSASLYLQSDSNVRAEDVKSIANIVKSQSLLMIAANQKDFEQLAERIEARDKSGTRIIYDRLYNRYIPINKRSIFAKVENAKSLEEMNKLIKDILK